MLAPTTTTPPVAGFLSLDLAFEAVPGERIYGLGQHAAFPWDHDFPQNGVLDQKGVPAMLLEPHDGVGWANGSILAPAVSILAD